MAVWLLLAVAVFITVFFKYLFSSSDKGKKYPPGPRSFPIVGNVLQMDFSNPHLVYDKWHKKFGPIVGAKLFNERITILNSWKVTKEALIRQGDNFSARPHMWSFDLFTGGEELGVFIANGTVWKEQRRFSLHALRDFGLGRSLLVEKIEREIESLFEELDKSVATDGSVDVVLPMKYAVVNIINGMLFGYRFEHGDPDFDRMQQLSQNVNDTIAKLMFAEFLPFLRPFALFFGKKELDRGTKEFYDYVEREYDNHEKDFDAETDSEDFTYAYMKEIQDRQKSGGDLGSFTKKQFVFVAIDLFSAGFETTAITLTWWVAYMIHHPEVQDKMRDEIARVVGGTPQWSDKTNLPYCQAVMAETQRVANIVPTGGFHSGYEDAELFGYFVPKGSMVVINHWSIMRDSEVFPEPELFKPERFISEGKFNDKAEGFIPFSAGKRQCLGEGMAKMELFMIATAMVWGYQIEQADELPDLVGRFMFLLNPKPFKAKLIRIER